MTPSTDNIQNDIANIQQLPAINTILTVVCQLTGMGFAAVARVTEDRWVACATRDLISFGLTAGGELKVKTTICDEIRQSKECVIFDDAGADPLYRDHHTPRIYGLKSYISMPILRSNGEFFGTLCAIDPAPAKINRQEVIDTFQLFSQLITYQLEALEQAQQDAIELEIKRNDEKLREEFIAVLGHDLRNPLSTINTGIALLQMRMPREEHIGPLKLMQNSVNRMTELINDILDYSRGRLSGGIQLEKTNPQDIAAELSSVIDGTSLAHHNREIRKELNISKKIGCDMPRINQLLSNLLNNALVHGAPDQPVVVRASDNDNTFVISVANGGTKIPAELQSKLFEPYTRDKSAGNSQGLGLGLYICAEIAKAHGGGMSVTSDSKETVFAFSMPI